MFNHYLKFLLTILKDTLILHTCKRFELYTFISVREIKTNSLLPKITDQQLHHFRHQWGVRKVGKTTLSDFCEDSLLQT